MTMQRSLARPVAVVLAGILSALAALPAQANVYLRNFPADAKKLELTAISLSHVKFGNDVYQLAPGAIIRDQRNFIVQPIGVTPPVKVRAQIGDDGLIRRIWLLTPEEQAVSTR